MAAGTTTVVVSSGDPAPDGNGSYSGAFTPTLNDAGQVSSEFFFTGTLGGSSDDSGIFRGDGSTLTQIAREGQAVPDGNGTFSDFSEPALNGAGQAAFKAFFIGAAEGSSDNTGLFRGDGTTLTQIAREGQASPDGNGVFNSFLVPALNSAELSGFWADLRATSGGTSDDEGLYVGDGSTLTQIARTGQAVPDGNGTFSELRSRLVGFNEAGQIAFSGRITGTTGGLSDNEGIFIGDGSTLTQVARKSQAAPDGNGTFAGFGSDVELNDAGEVVFWAGLIDTVGGSDDEIGIFRGDGVSLTQIARTGQSAPDGNGVFENYGTPTLNNNGQAAFWGGLIGTSGGFSDNIGIFRGDGTTLTQIVREGQPAPDGNGVFSDFNAPPAFNEAGQVAFSASLIGTSGESSDNSGIYFFDDTLGLFQIAREGDPLLGSTISALAFRADSPPDNEFVGLNNLGQIAYRFNLADGRQGIAIWTPPLPGDLNGDGFVGIEDLNIILSTWNQNVPPGDPAADPSGDGFVGIEDLNTVLGNWNAGTPPPDLALTAIPEPTTAMTLIGVVGLMQCWRRR